MKRTFLSHRLAVLGVTVLIANPLWAGSSKISKELTGLTGKASKKVIVQFKAPAGSLDLSAISLAGGIVNSTYNNLSVAAASIPEAMLESMANNPQVAYISPDRPLSQMLDYSAAAVNASVAWSSQQTGAGIGVAIIDSGITPVADLSLSGQLPKIVYRENFTSQSGPRDGFGHGTHVAGIIGSSGIESNCSNCTRSFKGIAPQALLIDLRVLDSNGAGSDSQVIAAIDRAIQLKNVFNIRVINLSVGRPVFESYKLDPLCQAVEMAWKAGITVVVAAGNDGRDNAIGNQGYGTIGSPANDPYVITVGAMKTMGTYSRVDDLVASYSSKGPTAIDFVVKPDLMAPGNHVVSLASKSSVLAAEPNSAVPISYYQSTIDNDSSKQFIMLNGTSMATPVVSGAVADLLQAEPSLTPDQVKARLMRTAYKTFPQSSVAMDDNTGQSYTSYYDMFTVGAGYLDLGAALTNHFVASGNALSPIASRNSVDGNVYLTFDGASSWNAGGYSPWSVQQVWGPTTVGPDRSVWGKGSVWGSNGLAGYDAIWSTRGVWGKESDSGTSTVFGTRCVWGKDSLTSDSDKMFSILSPGSGPRP